MKLEFIKRYPEFSAYRNAKGDLVYITDLAEVNKSKADLPLVQVDTATLFSNPNNTAALQREYNKAINIGWGNEEFLAFLRVVLTDPAPADDLAFCRNCGGVTGPFFNARKVGKGGLQSVCATCSAYYRECQGCHDAYTNMQAVNRRYWCGDCLRDRFLNCRACGMYYRNDDPAAVTLHKHGSGCCDSPAKEFTVRHDGNPPLANDTKTVVSMGAGRIDDVGYLALERYLNDVGEYNGAAVIRQVDPVWQKKEGNFPKRFSKLVYQTYRTKMSADVMAMVGTIGAEHSAKVSEIAVMISRELNNPSEWWYNGGSCWWGSAVASRCALKTNGGFGVMTYQSVNTTKPNGRIWALPVKQAADGYLAPTFETMDPDGFLVFNGYGQLKEYAGARVMAALAGMSYTKVGFEVNPIYLNNGGYLVGPEDFITPYTDKVVRMREMPQHATLFEAEQKAAKAEREARPKRRGLTFIKGKEEVLSNVGA